MSSTNKLINEIIDQFGLLYSLNSDSKIKLKALFFIDELFGNIIKYAESDGQSTKENLRLIKKLIESVY